MTTAHQKLRDTLLPVLQPYVHRISVFGSVARGESGPDSDIDILVALRPPEERPSLGLQWFALEAMLTKQLRQPVDLVTETALSGRIRTYIEADQVVLYEEG